MPSPNGPNRLTSLAAEGQKIVERLGGEWRPGGSMCRCPAHDDRTPSLSVRPGRQRLLFHCFAGCETGRIIHALSALQLHRSQPPAAPQSFETPADFGGRNRGAAVRLWAVADPIVGSPAEVYFASRGLTLAMSDLRYHRRTPYGRGSQVIFLPALLAAVRNDAGLVALHRTFLDPTSGRLANLPFPKRALGRPGEGCVRLRSPRDGVVGWAEGIESAMAATELTGVSCWATLGTERFAYVALPAGVTRLILFLDNDAGGRRAERLARQSQQGVDIEARYPAISGADWNDVLLQRAPR